LRAWTRQVTEEKHCRKCGVALTPENWEPSQKKFGNYICLPCRLLYDKEWRKRHLNAATEAHLRLKMTVLSHYSAELKCKCGFNDIRALSIDHVNGGGNKHAKRIGGGSGALYFWIKKHSFPEGFQVLCMNCQFIKRHEKGEVRRVDD